MIWVTIAGVVGCVLAGVALWMHKQRTIRTLVRAAEELARASQDLDLRRAQYRDLLERYRESARGEVRAREQSLQSEVASHDHCNVVDLINRRDRE